MIRLKKGSRMLGLAESFKKGLSERSVLAGVVMRADLYIDGFGFSFPTVGGLDATQKVLELYKSIGREDVNFICVSGCVISWFNVVDLAEVYDEASIPVISITYEESPGLEKYFKEYFPDDWERRVEIYRRNGGRSRVKLKTGVNVFVRGFGLSLEEALTVLNSFTAHGKFPEPVRVARILAHDLLKTFMRVKFSDKIIFRER